MSNDVTSYVDPALFAEYPAMTIDMETLFYEAAVDIGGRPDPVYRTTALGVLMDNFAEIARPSLPPHVYWNYLGSTEVNATAFVHKRNEFIGINIGTILVLHDLFLSLLSHRSFAPDIGTPSQTAVNLRGVTERIAYATKGRDSGHDIPRWLNNRPEDPVRKSYALALSHCALDFILQHELAHLEMGHLEFIENQMLGGRLFERREQDRRLWESDVSQACETDADRAAVGIALARLRRIQALPEQPNPTANFIGILKQQPYSYRAWHTAIGMLFFVFGLDDAAFGVDSERSHPHPHLRHLMAYHVGLLDTREDAPKCERAYQEGYDKASGDLVRACIEIAGRDFALKYIATSADLKRVWARLMERSHVVWKELNEAAPQENSSLRIRMKGRPIADDTPPNRRRVIGSKRHAPTEAA